jgi:peptidoglycan hydrolase CwlO-like protein
MWRFLLPAFAMMGALLVLFAGALSNLQSLPSLSDRDVALVGDPAPRRMPPPSPPPSLPAEQSPAPAVADQRVTRDALQRQIDDLLRQDSALQIQITQHKQELAQRPVERPSASATADQQATRDALQRQIDDLRRQGSSLQAGITDLQRQDSALQDQVAQHKQELAQRTAEDRSTSATAERAGRDSLQHQVADLQRQVADLQQQDGAIQGQIAQHRQEVAQRTQDLTQRSQELAQRTQELAQRTHDLDVARAEADRLQKGIDALREQRQSEEASLARLKAAQQQVAMAVPARPAAPRPAPPPTRPAQQPAQPVSLQQPTQPTPAPQPPRLMPAPAASQQLQTARQWLSAGRPDEARRVLAMVQTQMVFQPVTPDQPAAQGGNPSATDIGDAIRWLDMGASGQAMQSITRAIDDANVASRPVRAWSGYPTGAPSGGVPPQSGYYSGTVSR